MGVCGVAFVSARAERAGFFPKVGRKTVLWRAKNHFAVEDGMAGGVRCLLWGEPGREAEARMESWGLVSWGLVRLADTPHEVLIDSAQPLVTLKRFPRSLLKVVFATG